ncbi:hypothetical protein EVAR_13666_1 [Eumeta japonica]|uniref:Uncharacterized protein n=1 Tax=Eumeta variegata TaxID=151549 RepID=A0A4C1UBC8_EUMVA|nr:hypothetical protein EVAR_13666_1 [Eumeta japonica]
MKIHSAPSSTGAAGTTTTAPGPRRAAVSDQPACRSRRRAGGRRERRAAISGHYHAPTQHPRYWQKNVTKIHGEIHTGAVYGLRPRVSSARVTYCLAPAALWPARSRPFSVQTVVPPVSKIRP